MGTSEILGDLLGNDPLLVQEILIILFWNKIGAKKASGETELEELQLKVN